ncbi:glycosyltransferase [Bacillus pseudomycoides]|uniref:CgeB family protein n=1 Tax=Bacillus TaxID=1386 RepID=UPI000371A695|nr:MULTISPECIES: glycosyltransferase [Bacillus]MED4650745.1 glycosyltransferase [Bacillus pseudomycoides]PEE06155.1 protein CgeB [Bacillus pseudomycoides]PEM77087.1 protein CgeB [Bacillus pseudomycoides]PHC88841.1 protein CgeB [Bacillus pseudomycoides]
MKLLYISSGYLGIYDYLDQSMKTALSDNGYKWTCFHPSEPIENIRSIVTTFQPQVVLTILGDNLSIQAIQYFKENGIQLACWMTEDPYYFDKTYQIIDRFDYIFTIDTGALKQYQLVHQNAHYLPLGTNHSIFKPRSVEHVYKSDLLLVGYPYQTRVNLIHFLLKNTNYALTLIGKGWRNRLQKVWRNNARVMIEDTWMNPEKVSYFYNGASIVLNPHRSNNFLYNQNTSKVMNESINNRTFDIAACGAFQLIEEKPNLRSFFTEEEMISYQDYEDCLCKVITYMNDKKKKEIIAQKAQKIVIGQHTFCQRIKEMVKIIQS